MQLGRSTRVFGVGVGLAFVACGSKTAPTPVNDPPTIVCPIAPAVVDSLDGSAQSVSYGAPTVTGGQAPLNTSCLPISGSSFPLGTTSVTCTTSDARSRSASCTFPVIVQPPPKLAVTSFLAFGDSITWGEDGRDSTSRVLGQHVFARLPQDQQYPDILQEELQARYRQQMPTVCNQGNPGESLADTTPEPESPVPNQATFGRFVSLTSSQHYDAVLILEGSNDVDAAASDSRVLSPAIENLKRMIGDAKSRGIRVVIATIPPMVPPGADNRARGAPWVSPFNDMVRALATSEGIPLTDVYAAFGSDAPSLIGFDGLHPNPAGYERIAETFFATIKDSFETRPTTSKIALRRPRLP